MEIYDNNMSIDNSSSHAAYDAKKAFASSSGATPPSPRTDSESNQHEEDYNDDVFRFDAPAYYDLKNPEFEAEYVNNADGYFTNEYTPGKYIPADTVDTAIGSSGGQTTPRPASSIPQPPVLNTPLKQRAQLGGDENTLRTPAFDRFQQQQQQQQDVQTRSLHSSLHEDRQPTHMMNEYHQAHHNTEMAEEERQLELRMSQYREPPKIDADVVADEDERMSDADSEDTLRLDTSEDMNIEELSSDPAEHVEKAPSRSQSRLYEDKLETFDEVFAQYASSSQSSTHSMAHLLQEPSAYHFSPHSSRHSSQHEDAHGLPPVPRLPSATSRLMQPTQAFLRRIHTEHAIREQSYMEGAPLEDKPFRLTQPRAPRLLTSMKAEQANRDPKDPSRMSYTSRELLKIQEERLRVQMETMKIREFHEKTKAQRPPANVHQRSTKQLTIPVSPYLEVGHRTRRFHQSDSGANDDGAGGERPHQVIRPETLLARDFSLPVSNQHHDPHELTTAERASRRNIHHEELPPQKPSAPDYSRMKVGGLTQPLTPQLQTTRRAQASQAYRRPVEITNQDEIELSKKFHAQSVPRSVLESRKPPSPMKAAKPPLTNPVSPKLSTSSRSAHRQSAAVKAAAAIADLEKRRKEREQQRLKAKEAAQRQPPPAPRRPTVPETPELKSIRLHRQYQENLRRRIEAEEEEMKRQREFKANPIRIASTLQPFQGSKKPLTEVVPFSLPGEQYHERARERIEAKRREEEQRLQASVQFKAMPMPAVHDSSNQENGAQGFHVKPSSKPLTRFAAPQLASDRRAAERAAFDAAERERRTREEEYKKQLEEETRRLQEEEIKRLRREKLQFHARPVPETRGFMLKPSDKPLTEPQSPALHYHPHRSGSNNSE
ncbi:Targeting protein for isoform 1, partial [Globisporangium splendens]